MDTTIVKELLAAVEGSNPIEALAATATASGVMFASVDMTAAQRDDLLDWFAEQVRTNTAQNVDYREAMEISGGKLQ